MNKVFSVASTDGETYLNPGRRGFWSIVRPVNLDIINYVANPSFEAGVTTYWHNDPNTNNATLSISARSYTNQDAAYDGNFALKATSILPGAPYGINYGPDSWGELDGQIPLGSGQNMHLMAHVKAGRGDLITLTANVDGVVAAVMPNLIPRTTTMVATGNWQRIKVRITNQRPSAVNLQIYLRVQPGPTTLGYVLFDAISAARIDLSDYFDGDMPGATWGGKPFLSASTMSRFSREIGQEIFLNDINFNVISYTGHGLPPITNDVIQYAQGGGAYYNRSWPESRTISITGQFESRYGIRDLHKMHSRLVELVGLHRFAVDPQPFILRYRLTNNENDTTGVLEIPVVYKDGLQGSISGLYQERVTLQLDAYEDVFWRTWGTKTIALRPSTATTVCYKGTAPAPMRIYIEGQTVSGLNVDFYNVENQTLGAAIYLQNSPSLLLQPVTAALGLIIGDLDRSCSNVYYRNKTTGATTDLTGKIVRPYSSPSEFVLVHGNNDVIAVFATHPGITPRVWATYRERYLSVTDVWRVAVPDVGESEDFSWANFIEACR